MTDQPIIIQESDNNKKRDNQKWLSNSQKQFFQILDTVQSYDSLSNQIRLLHQEAMISLATIKFASANNLTINSHRCLPAFKTLNSQGQLEEGYVPFTKTIDEDKYYEQYQEQIDIQQQCLKKQKNRQTQQLKKEYKQNEILYRFNVMNQPQKVLSVASNFETLLKKLLVLLETKKQVERHLLTREYIPKQ